MQSYVLNEVPEGMLPVGVRMIQVGTCSRKKDAFASVRGLRPSEPLLEHGAAIPPSSLVRFFPTAQSNKEVEVFIP